MAASAKLTRRCTALLVGALAMAPMTGCHASTRGGRASTPPPTATSPASVVVSILEGDAELDEVFYARSDVRPTSWASAAVLRIPPASNSGLTMLAESTPGDERPLLIVLRGSSHGEPRVGVTVSEVGRTRVTVVPDSSDGTRPCLGGDWLAAFFVEGFGPRPRGPAVVVFSANGPDGQPRTVHRLRVDPTRHTVRAAPALVLRTGDLGIDTTITDRLVVTASVSASIAATPLMLSRSSIGGRYRWLAAVGHPSRKEVSFLQLASTPRPVPDRWVVFLLDPVPPC